MKGKLYLVLIIIAGFALTTQAVQAFDPGAWLKRGIVALDKKAVENFARNGNDRNNLSTSKNHNDTVSRIKKYMRSEEGGSKKRKR